MVIKIIYISFNYYDCRYYIHSQISNFEQYKIYIKIYLETVSKYKNLNARKTSQLFNRYELFPSFLSFCLPLTCMFIYTLVCK